MDFVIAQGLPCVPVWRHKMVVREWLPKVGADIVCPLSRVFVQ